MNCPQCGLYLPDPNVDRCPRCGWVPATGGGPTTSTPGYGPWSAPAGAPPSMGAPTPYGAGFPPGPPPQDDWAQTQQRGYIADAPGPAVPPTLPPSAPYGQFAPPSAPYYGQAAPPSMPAYGQYAPPSMPMYGQAAPPSMGQQPMWGSPFPPSPPPRRSNIGLIIGVTLIVVLLLGGGAGFLIYAANQNNAGANTSSNPTATTAPTATPASHALFQDSFNDSSSGWANDSHCGYHNDGYHVNDGFICYAPAGDFTDAAVSVTVKQISGSVRYPYGIAFRINSTNHTHYEFDIDSNGKWAVFKCGASNCTRLVDYVANAALHPNLNASNTLKVVMQSSHFTFYANGTQIGSTDDSSYASGLIGVDCDAGIEAVFTSFEIDSVS